MKNGKLQAKDIDGAALLTAIEQLRWTPWPSGRSDLMPRWVFVREVIEAVGIAAPYKVIVAKLAALKRQGKICGCLCGCRGDLELPDHDALQAAGIKELERKELEQK